MKLAVVVLACMAAVAVQSSALHKDVKLARADPEKQQFILDVLLHMGDNMMFEELIKRGKNVISEETHFTTYNHWMTEFCDSYKTGSLLPQGEFFSAVNLIHLQQAKGLFNLFYNAKDWETFVDTVIWARINVNQGMFVYALTLSMIHREDMAGMMMPAIYEIFPQMFFNSKLIMEVEKFDWEMWNKQIMLEKEWMTIYEKKHIKNIQGKFGLITDWKMWQWWKLMGLDEQWHTEKKCILRDVSEIQLNDYKWTALWSDMQMVWTPVDYTRDIEIINEESKLTYLTEDLGWNSFWYYLNMDYAMILDSKKFHLDNDRRGEWWMFVVQQILARYNMERLSHHMCPISGMDWNGVVKMGYDSKLISYNGIPFSMRKNYWEIQSFENIQLRNMIMNIERRINDAIALGKFTTKDGNTTELGTPESIEAIGNMIQGNADMIEKDFFGYWLPTTTTLLSNNKYGSRTSMPNVFSNFETMLRDPLFYQLLTEVRKFLDKFKMKLTPYTYDDLLVKGVQITDIHIDKMVTYFDLVDWDVTNLMNTNPLFVNGKFVWNKVMLARQMRLNHKPFTMKMMVNSDMTQKVIIRTFLGPKYDEFGQVIDLTNLGKYMVDIDAFSYGLNPGSNIIKRCSTDYDWTIKDRTTNSELYKLVMMAIEGKYDLPLDISQPHCGFPDRLLLPRGWVKGMPMKLFVVITPYDVEQDNKLPYDHRYLCGIASGSRHIDSLPFGYPMDRTIKSITPFTVPNMAWKDVKIYHLDTLEKYLDHKYEHFGSFDYNFN